MKHTSHTSQTSYARDTCTLHKSNKPRTRHKSNKPRTRRKSNKHARDASQTATHEAQVKQATHVTQVKQAMHETQVKQATYVTSQTSHARSARTHTLARAHTLRHRRTPYLIKGPPLENSGLNGVNSGPYADDCICNGNCRCWGE